jgi:glycosyltransferase involved in cell wall biosynthesis
MKSKPQQDKKKGSRKILHLTPHLGGGVGTVVLNYLKYITEKSYNTHSIASLDTINKKAQDLLNAISIDYIESIHTNTERLLSLCEEADLVVIHWWNHPLLYDFMIRNELPPSRVIIWSHISGFSAPQVFTETLLGYPDCFVFTTPISYQTECVMNFNRSRQIFKTIWSTGGVDQFSTLHRQEHENFTVGYIGTVDFAKMHPQFLAMSQKVSIKNCRFIVCGGANEQEIFKQAEALGIANQFEFTGYVEDIRPYLAQFDVFGYPLNPSHYGTCDQALAEAMACGIPPIVFNNKMESSMIQDHFSGLVVEDEDTYAKAIEELFKNQELYEELSKNVKQYATSHFSLQTMAESWEKCFDEVMLLPKKAKKWEGKYRGSDVTASQVFLEAIGNSESCFRHSYDEQNHSFHKQLSDTIAHLGQRSPQWKSQTKGTPRHYVVFFPDDLLLETWSNLL